MKTKKGSAIIRHMLPDRAVDDVSPNGKPYMGEVMYCLPDTIKVIESPSEFIPSVMYPKGTAPKNDMPHHDTELADGRVIRQYRMDYEV